MSTLKYMSMITTLTVFTAFISMILHGYLESRELNKLVTILSGLVALEKIHNNNTNKIVIDKPKIAIGFGSCSDVYVRAITFLNYTNLIDDQHKKDTNDGDAVKTAEFHVDDITNEQELLQSFGHYFRMGAAAERYTSDKKLFTQLIEATKLKKHKDEIRWDLGGNAPVMGTRFFKEGADVLLAATMSKHLRTFVPKEIKITGDPNDNDDIHLIMEYKTGEEWGTHKAPRANRFILHNDQNNPMLSSLPLFKESLKSYNPRLLVVSGLQMMDSYPFVEGVREKRLKELQHLLSTQSQSSTLIHFEMASFVEIELLRLLSKFIIPYSNSLGMNEQELDNLQQYLQYDKVSFVSESNPRVAIALNQMRTIFKIINTEYFRNKTNNNKKMKTDDYNNNNNNNNDDDEDNDKKGLRHRRMLTRIHVHTLAYQAILIVRNSEWKNIKNAAAKAALTAHRHVCGSQNINPEGSTLILDDSFSTTVEHDYDLIKSAPKRIQLKPNDPVSCWNETLLITKNELLDIEICVAPVLVCKTAKQTAGAGDNISAAGLILQI